MSRVVVQEKLIMMSATVESEEEGSSPTPNETKKGISISMGSRAETSSPVAPLAELLNRKLGSNEAFAFNCHNQGNLNTVCGLTLLTKNSIDEGNLTCV